MKNDYDISKQFQDDLIKAYNQVAYTCLSQAEAYKKTVKQPAPRYYISPKQALQVISPMVKGDFSKVDRMKYNRKRMYSTRRFYTASDNDKVVELSEKRAFIGKSLFYILHFAVSSPAPEFFVSHRSIEQVRSYLKNRYYDDDGKVKVVLPHRAKAYEKLKAKRAKRKELRERLRNSPL